MSARSFLLLVVLSAAAAALGGLLVVHQLQTEEIGLNTSGVTTGDEGAYLGRARGEAPELWAAKDSALLRIGFGLCAAVRQVPEQTAEPRAIDGLSDRELRAVTDSATRYLCPPLRGKVTGYLRGVR